MMNTSITIKKFKIDDLPLSNSWLILGRIGSGKTTMMKNLLYFNKHKYCTAKIQTNDPEGYVDWCKIVDPIFVNLGYTTEGTKRYIDRCIKIMKTSEGQNSTESRSCLILDDIYDRKHFKSSEFIRLIKIMTRHSGSMIMFASHYPLEVPPIVRENCMYIAIFDFDQPNTRKKLYENYGGCCGSKEIFNAILDKFSINHNCIIINNKNHSTNIMDKIFYYEPIEINKKWRFGCDECKLWNDKRLKKDYKN